MPALVARKVAVVLRTVARKGLLAGVGGPAVGGRIGRRAAVADAGAAGACRPVAGDVAVIWDVRSAVAGRLAVAGLAGRGGAVTGILAVAGHAVGRDSVARSVAVAGFVAVVRTIGV